jgi:hypothetical protein
MSKEIADAIGIHGKARPLGLSTIGDSNLVQQAFKTEIDLHDKDGTHMGKAWVHVISGFVDLKAVDWSLQAAKFSRLASLLSEENVITHRQRQSSFVNDQSTDS